MVVFSVVDGTVHDDRDAGVECALQRRTQILGRRDLQSLATERAGERHEVGVAEIDAGGATELALLLPADHAVAVVAHDELATIEYRVAHPRWRFRPAATASIEGDMAAFYGAEWREVLSARPVSAYLAEGSPVTVSRPRRVT